MDVRRSDQGKEERPELLVIVPSSVFIVYEQQFCERFNVLKAYESPLPIDVFLKTKAQSAQAVICYGKSPITEAVLRLLPSLRLVVTSGTGVNHIDLAECRRRGIAVCNTSDVFSEDTADYAVGLLIDVLRKVSYGDRFVRSGVWPTVDNFPLGFQLGGKHVGIVGLGNIGSKVAKRLEAFGCIISYNSRQKKPAVPYTFYPNVSDLAANSNILVLCCSLTAKTRHMVNKHVLEALGKDGILINVARGAVVEEEELVRCLVRGEIGGAGLDVFENEPQVPPELLGLDNVVVNPHRGAFTVEAFREAFELVLGNLEAFFSNKPLVSPVDLDA
nr:glyoxylate/hydroxypyruvate reductase HPR3-like [Ipomoea batatas]